MQKFDINFWSVWFLGVATGILFAYLMFPRYIMIEPFSYLKPL